MKGFAVLSPYLLSPLVRQLGSPTLFRNLLWVIEKMNGARVGFCATGKLCIHNGSDAFVKFLKTCPFGVPEMVV